MTGFGLFPAIETLESRISCSLDRFNYLSKNGTLTITTFFTELDNYEKNVRTSPIREELKDDWKNALATAQINGTDEEKEIVEKLQRDLKGGRALKFIEKPTCKK